MKKKETLFDILLEVSELRMDIETAEKRILRLLDVVGQSEQLKAFADYVQRRMWEGEDKDLSEFVEDFLSL